jgi:hypothetical protein
MPGNGSPANRAVLRPLRGIKMTAQNSTEMRASRSAAKPPSDASHFARAYFLRRAGCKLGGVRARLAACRVDRVSPVGSSPPRPPLPCARPVVPVRRGGRVGSRVERANTRGPFAKKDKKPVENERGDGDIVEEPCQVTIFAKQVCCPEEKSQD